jgi:hypothetical protein
MGVGKIDRCLDSIAEGTLRERLAIQVGVIHELPLPELLDVYPEFSIHR